MLTSRRPTAYLPAETVVRSTITQIYEGTNQIRMVLARQLHREDFTSRFIAVGTSISDGTAMASIDWEAAITALDAGQLPSGGGERRVLRLAASIAGGIPVSLYDTLPGLDYRASRIVIKAIMHATGQTQAWPNES